MAALYRAERTVLKERLSDAEKRIAEKAAESEWWRNKYFEADAKVDVSLGTLRDTVDLLKRKSTRTGQG